MFPVAPDSVSPSSRLGLLAAIMACLVQVSTIAQEAASDVSAGSQEAQEALETQEAQGAPQDQAAPEDEASAQVQYPLAVATSSKGTIYIGDLKLPGIWQLADGRPTVLFAGSKQLRTPLKAIRCLAVDAQGQLYAGDSATRQVYRLDTSGQPQPIVPPSDKGLGPFGVPMGLAFNSKGELFISDREFRCIWKVAADGGEPQKFVDVAAPGGICFDPEDRLWVVSLVDNPLRRFSPDGAEEVIVKGRPFEYPHSVALDDDGAAYVVDGYQRTVWKVTEGAEPQAWFKDNRLVNPVDIKRAGDQMLLVDPRAKLLLRINLDATADAITLN